MSMTDILSDSITRIRNAHRASHSSVILYKSKAVFNMLNVMLEEGYIESIESIGEGIEARYQVGLLYFKNRPVIQNIERVSKPGCRVYRGVTDIPKVRNGLGVAIISTSKGVMSDSEARRQKVGGEVLCTIF